MFFFWFWVQDNNPINFNLLENLLPMDESISKALPQIEKNISINPSNEKEIIKKNETSTSIHDVTFSIITMGTLL